MARVALRRVLAIAAFAAGVAPSAGWAAGRVDAARGVVTCSGVGAPSLRDAAGSPVVARAAAERSARKMARAACRAALEELPAAAGGGSLRDAAARDPSLAARVDAALRKARGVGVPRYFADGGVALELELALGAVADLVVVPPPPGPATERSHAPAHDDAR